MDTNTDSMFNRTLKPEPTTEYMTETSAVFSNIIEASTTKFGTKSNPTKFPIETSLPYTEKEMYQSVSTPPEPNSPKSTKFFNQISSRIQESKNEKLVTTANKQVFRRTPSYEEEREGFNDFYYDYHYNEY